METAKIIGSKIKRLMDEKGLSLRSLSDVINVSHPTLKRYIEGEKIIDSDKLLKLARYFNKPFDYFFKEEEEQLGFMFRADKPKENIKAMDLNRLRTSLRGYIDIVKNIKVSIVPPNYTINDSDYDKNSKEFVEIIERIANEQRRQFNIEYVIPENYFEMLESQGIHVLAIDFGNDQSFGVSSFSQTHGSFIIINDSKKISEERKIFSLFHEYAHLLFHRHQYSKNGESIYYKSGRTDRSEKAANLFAGFFLMPRHLVKQYANDRKSIDPIQMKHHFKVSMQTLYVVLYAYGFITKKQHQEFWKKINWLGIKEIEKDPIEPHTIEEKNIRLIKHIKELYSEDAISVNKVSQVLGLNPIETRNLVKSWSRPNERTLHLR